MKIINARVKIIFVSIVYTTPQEKDCEYYFKAKRIRRVSVTRI